MDRFSMAMFFAEGASSVKFTFAEVHDVRTNV